MITMKYVNLVVKEVSVKSNPYTRRQKGCADALFNRILSTLEEYNEYVHKAETRVSPPDEDGGEFFIDFDDNSALWCVLHTDRKNGYSSKFDAQDEADRRNKKRKDGQ